jgi:tetratricopeptide (TPR) repeat protein
MYRSSWFLAAALLGTNVAVVQQVAGAKSAVEVGRIAKAITVEIKAIGSTDIGSGILLQRQGDVYTVLTSGHVANKSAAFTIKTADGQVQQAIAGSIRLASNSIDLGIMKFRSSNNYTVAKIGTSNSLEELSPIYVAGFPERTRLIEAGTLNITEGKVKGKANQGNSMGYSLIYSNDTYYGMSGGPVLNSEGELIAIHGQGEREENSERKDESGRPIKTDRNLGITIERFGSVALAMGIKLDQQIAVLPQKQPLNASDYLLRGGQNAFGGYYKQAIADYTQAIALNPKYFEAHYNRAEAKSAINDVPGAFADYNQSIIINPKDSFAYFGRARIKEDKLKDYRGALADYDQSITLNPKNYKAYYRRAQMKEDNLDDYRGALADYDQSITLSPKKIPYYAYYYFRRAQLKNDKLKDYRGALTDYDQAITLTPNDYLFLLIRAKLKANKLNDLQGALIDYNQMIAFYPKRSDFYYVRAEFKEDKLNDLQGALKDYDQAIITNSEYSYAYHRRGTLKCFRLNDKTGGIQDLLKAEGLYYKQGMVKDGQVITEILRKLGVYEN